MAQAKTIPQWRANLHLLRAWAGGWGELGDLLGLDLETVRSYATPSDRVPGEDTKQCIYDLRERWEDEHVRSAEMHSLLPRVQVQLESARRAKDWGRVDQLIERIDAILEQKDSLVCEA